ncbi:hypothetical protein BaRGS_00003890 [Batillaria attramentaria]|uniref:RHD domain-containing protein n=1 Tax=Batillaria attramentaria TaxID=370345 RepID=A0ABD0LZP9_9CAEN
MSVHGFGAGSGRIISRSTNHDEETTLRRLTTFMATPKLKARGKGIAAKQPKLTPGFDLSKKPSVEIIKCIGFQKFRYCGENRPGKKYQEKDFLQLALCNMSGKNVKVQIVCFDADKPGDIHPNGLVGRDCDEGIYTKTYPISKPTQILRIPYLRTERILTKKKDNESAKSISDVLKARANLLPHPYSQRCLEQCKRNTKYDTTRVCFGVIVTFEDGSLQEPLCVISNVVQNASEKTTLKIIKLSSGFISAREGGQVDIFTSEDGPPMTAGKCTLKVSTKDWDSEETKPSAHQIMYKRVVTYYIPPYKLNPYTDSPVEGTLQLSCTQSGQSCVFPFQYEPGADHSKRQTALHSNRLSRKRQFEADDADENQGLVDADLIKLNLKAKVQCRQAQDEPVVDLRKRARTNAPVSNGNIPLMVSQALGQQSQTTLASKDKPLEEENIIWAKDILTGEVVYLRADSTNPSSQTDENVIVYVHEGEQALSSSISATPSTLTGPKAVAVPTSEWSSMTLSSGGNSTLRTLEPARQVRTQSTERRAGPVTRTASKFLSPWLVDEPAPSPLMNGDISFTSTRPSDSLSHTAITTASTTVVKQELVDSGLPILSRGLPFSIDSGAELTSTTLTSLGVGSFIEANLADLRYDRTGNLDSMSVFEMVQPYMAAAPQS